MKIKKTESTIRPLDFRIGDHKGNLIEVVFFDDIEEVKKKSEDGTEQTVYLYYEYTVKVVNRSDLESYINDNFEIWLQVAKDNFITSKSAEIREKRNKLLEESDKYMILDRLTMNFPQEISLTNVVSVVKDFFKTLSDIKNGSWAKYRQELRELPNQEGFPYDVKFPDKPEE